MNPLEFPVYGLDPVPFSSIGEPMRKWRQHVHDQAVQHSKRVATQQITVTTTFSVELEFGLRDDRYAVSDLDNLCIPVLNTLFLDQHQSSGYPSGALFGVGDNQITTLLLRKLRPLNENMIGVYVRIRWT